jgi:hypothetical protein
VELKVFVSPGCVTHGRCCFWGGKWDTSVKKFRLPKPNEDLEVRNCVSPLDPFLIVFAKLSSCCHLQNRFESMIEYLAAVIHRKCIKCGVAEQMNRVKTSFFTQGTI